MQYIRNSLSLLMVKPPQDRHNYLSAVRLDTLCREAVDCSATALIFHLRVRVKLRIVKFTDRINICNIAVICYYINDLRYYQRKERTKLIFIHTKSLIWNFIYPSGFSDVNTS